MGSSLVCPENFGQGRIRIPAGNFHRSFLRQHKSSIFHKYIVFFKGCRIFIEILTNWVELNLFSESNPQFESDPHFMNLLFKSRNLNFLVVWFYYLLWCMILSYDFYQLSIQKVGITIKHPFFQKYFEFETHKAGIISFPSSIPLFNMIW